MEGMLVPIGADLRPVARLGEAGDENKPGETQQVPKRWPFAGQIQISSLTASYDETEPVKALESIDLSIEAGEKIGICGRTGR